MTGIFPQDFDGGLPANPNTPNDPIQAFLHRHRLPVDTPALYYGNGCNVRLRPHVINSLISEIASIADRAGVGYRASSLQNAEIAVRYLIQRGLPHGAMLIEQNPWHFTFTLDPPPPCYTDFMTVSFIPRMAPETEFNRGYVRMNMNGLGYCPLYRWDGAECKMNDILNLKPFLAVHFNGAWYIIGRIPPEFRPGGIDLWVRTDGNDQTGDGTKNSADRAFRTIDGAFQSVGERFMATPLFVANIKLGIPGDYEAGWLYTFGGGVQIFGGGPEAGGWGGGNRWNYRIMPRYNIGEDCWFNLIFAGINSVVIHGVTLPLVNSSNGACCLLVGANSSCSARNCAWEALTSNPRGRFIEVRDALFGFDENPYQAMAPSTYFNGNGQTISGNTSLWRSVHGCLVGGGPYIHVNTNYHCLNAFLHMDSLSACTWGGAGQNIWGGVTGRQFAINALCILYHNLYGASGPIPGTLPGVMSYGSQVIPGG